MHGKFPLPFLKDTETELDARGRIKLHPAVRWATYSENVIPLSIVFATHFPPVTLNWLTNTVVSLSVAQNPFITNVAGLFAIAVPLIILFRFLLGLTPPPTPPPPPPTPSPNKRDKSKWSIHMEETYSNGKLVHRDIDITKEDIDLLGWLVNGVVLGVPARKLLSSTINQLIRRFMNKPKLVARTASISGLPLGGYILAGRISGHGPAPSPRDPKGLKPDLRRHRRHQLMILKGKLVSLWHYLHGDRLKVGFAH